MGRGWAADDTPPSRRRHTAADAFVIFRIPRGAPEAEVYLPDIAAGGDGILALAHEPNPFNPESRLAVWTSVDGAFWRRVGNGMERSDASPQTPFAFSDRLVVLGGTDGGRLVVWLGDPVDLP